MKQGIKFFLAACFGLLFFLVAAPSFMAPGRADNELGMKALALNYHKVEDVHHSLSIPVDEFDAQMSYLKDSGFSSISPAELYESLSGNRELPENPVLITFDDGYQDNYVNAYPILKKYGFSATIFVITDFVGKPGYLTWEEIREMQKNGFTIASHTVSHKSMTDLTDEELKKELTDSKATLEKELGSPIEFMAYPAGAYNLHIAQIVKDAGYKAAFTIKYGNIDKGSNVYALERVPIFQESATHRAFLDRTRYKPLFERFGWQKT